MEKRSIAITILGMAVAVVGSFLVLNFYAAPNEAWLLKGGMSLSSDGFANDTAIPSEYTCKGVDISPPLAWSGSPSSTQSYAILMEDPDAPSGIFTHWILYNIQQDVVSLSSNQPSGENISGIGSQGRNDFGTIGYHGPCPSEGSVHHYRILVFALDTSFNQQIGSRADLFRAIMGHVTASGTLIGTFG